MAPTFTPSPFDPQTSGTMFRRSVQGSLERPLTSLPPHFPHCRPTALVFKFYNWTHPSPLFLLGTLPIFSLPTIFSFSATSYRFNSTFLVSPHRTSPCYLWSQHFLLFLPNAYHTFHLDVLCVVVTYMSPLPVSEIKVHMSVLNTTHPTIFAGRIKKKKTVPFPTETASKQIKSNV